MSSKILLSVCAIGALLAACGGSVSLGNTGGELGQGTDDGTKSSSSSSTSSSSGGGGAGGADECAKEKCGPALGLPNYQCSDGTTGGPTGRCLQNKDGTCGWEVHQCPTQNACFDSSGNLDPTLRKCSVAADCTTITYQDNCCGQMRVVGVASASKTQAEKCGADRTASWPACECAVAPTKADDGTIDSGGQTAAVTCHSGTCESTFTPTKCGTEICTATQSCCGPAGLPACYDNGSPCPISQRKMKKDITYLSVDDRQRLSDELMSIPLATYRYKTEGPTEKEHLGFIIDDIGGAASPAVMASGERVDLYGYNTMTVAAVQIQAKQIAELQRQVEELRKDCKKK